MQPPPRDSSRSEGAGREARGNGSVAGHQLVPSATRKACDFSGILRADDCASQAWHAVASVSPETINTPILARLPVETQISPFYRFMVKWENNSLKS